MSQGKRMADRPGGMSKAAADIAVSELTRVPIERTCGWMLLAVTHPEGRDGHETVLISGPAGMDDYAWMVMWLRQAADDLEATT